MAIDKKAANKCGDSSNAQFKKAARLFCDCKTSDLVRRLQT